MLVALFSEQQLTLLQQDIKALVLFKTVIRYR